MQVNICSIQCQISASCLLDFCQKLSFPEYCLVQAAESLMMCWKASCLGRQWQGWKRFTSCTTMTAVKHPPKLLDCNRRQKKHFACSSLINTVFLPTSACDEQKRKVSMDFAKHKWHRCFCRNDKVQRQSHAPGTFSWPHWNTRAQTQWSQPAISKSALVDWDLHIQIWQAPWLADGWEEAG
jgi:hypothetical protein